MIKDLDLALEAMLTGEARAGSELETAPISFAAPDATWRGGTQTLALNVYLYRLGENRALRSNERRIRVANGAATVDRPPVRIECRYAITAWNLAVAVAGVDQELQEHRLLSQVLAVLTRNPTLPRKYMTGLVANQEIDPPMLSAGEDDQALPTEFWTAIDTHPRPVITCDVTIALAAAAPTTGPAMTTAQLTVNGEESLVIGGVVRDAGTDDPVEGAWVRVAETGAEALTDGRGRFTFVSPEPGSYTVLVRAAGYKDGGGPVSMPSPTGNYDVVLNPI